MLRDAVAPIRAVLKELHAMRTSPAHVEHTETAILIMPGQFLREESWIPGVKACRD